MRLQRLFVLLILAFVIPGIAHAQSKATKICVWADSEDLGVLIPTQAGGSVNSISGSEVSFIQQMNVSRLGEDKSNNVMDPCPQAGENIELDVIVGEFLGAYVASVSTLIQKKDGTHHITSSVIAAKTDKLVVADIALVYSSLKLKAMMGLAK